MLIILRCCFWHPHIEAVTPAPLVGDHAADPPPEGDWRVHSVHRGQRGYHQHAADANVHWDTTRGAVWDCRGPPTREGGNCREGTAYCVGVAVGVGVAVAVCIWVWVCIGGCGCGCVWGGNFWVDPLSKLTLMHAFVSMQVYVCHAYMYNMVLGFVQISVCVCACVYVCCNVILQRNCQCSKLLATLQ